MLHPSNRRRIYYVLSCLLANHFFLSAFYNNQEFVQMPGEPG